MKSLRQKVKEMRNIVKEEINNKVNPLILKAATIEQCNESENHYSFLATNYAGLVNSYNELNQKWQRHLQVDTSARNLVILNELSSIGAKLQTLGAVAQQISAIYTRIIERHNDGVNPHHAKNDCTQWLNEQKQLAENIFYPQYYALKNEIDLSLQQYNAFVPVLVPVTAAVNETITVPAVEQARSATPTLLFSNMTLSAIPEEQVTEEQDLNEEIEEQDTNPSLAVPTRVNRM